MIGGSVLSKTPYPYEAHCLTTGTPSTTCSPSGLPENPGLYDNWTDVTTWGRLRYLRRPPPYRAGCGYAID